MPLVDLSKVTDAFRLLISEGIATSAAWAPNAAPSVLPVPPEAVEGDALSLYLFAVGESPVVANLPGPVAGNPLGLELHYQLAVHTAVNPPDTASMQREQLLLGLAMKAIHDRPRLHDAVEVNGVNLFDAVGLASGNTMGIELRRLEPDQAITWWTASPSAIKAAAYYTVTVALIQEERPAVSGPPVLQHEVFGFTGSAPHLTGTTSTQHVGRPGEPTRPVVTSPAQVVVGQAFTILGAGLGGNTSVQVLAGSWDDWVALAGASYQMLGQTEGLTTAFDRRVGPHLVVPGLMRVRVERTDERRTSDGSTRLFSAPSNETVVTVLPTVVVIAPANPGDPYVIEGGAFAGPGIEAGAVRVLVDADELVAVAGAPTAGEYRVVDTATIELVPPDPVVELTRIRVLVNGAEALPSWIEAP